jgi:DNA-binding response OmpR family regulator
MSATPQPFDRLRILIVEDEMMVALDLEDMIAEFGHEVAATAMRIDAALDHARETPIDFAILDVNVAGRMSFPVAEILLQRGVPFIFATGYGVSVLPDGLKDQKTLQKPFRRGDLQNAIAAHAARLGRE